MQRPEAAWQFGGSAVTPTTRVFGLLSYKADYKVAGKEEVLSLCAYLTAPPTITALNKAIVNRRPIALRLVPLIETSSKR